eukprot:GHRR01035789.1.p1 GENE.GHRR01035789.1~~GHRR01035789.1.p1  ORF type:complete len:148 (+),score=39.09 GHRR01035789.1:1142-1585(+)
MGILNATYRLHITITGITASMCRHMLKMPARDNIRQNCMQKTDNHAAPVTAPMQCPAAAIRYGPAHGCQLSQSFTVLQHAWLTYLSSHCWLQALHSSPELQKTLSLQQMPLLPRSTAPAADWHGTCGQEANRAQSCLAEEVSAVPDP